MVPTMLHRFSELSAMATNEDIKVSDLTLTTQTFQASQKQSQDCRTSRYQQMDPYGHIQPQMQMIHKVAFGMSTRSTRL